MDLVVLAGLGCVRGFMHRPDAPHEKAPPFQAFHRRPSFRMAALAAAGTESINVSSSTRSNLPFLYVEVAVFGIDQGFHFVLAVPAPSLCPGPGPSVQASVPSSRRQEPRPGNPSKAVMAVNLRMQQSSYYCEW